MKKIKKQKPASKNCEAGFCIERLKTAGSESLCWAKQHRIALYPISVPIGDDTHNQSVAGLISNFHGVGCVGNGGFYKDFVSGILNIPAVAQTVAFRSHRNADGILGLRAGLLCDSQLGHAIGFPGDLAAIVS